MRKRKATRSEIIERNRKIVKDYEDGLSSLLSVRNADTERTANGVPLSPVPVEQAADARRVPEKSLSKASMM